MIIHPVTALACHLDNILRICYVLWHWSFQFMWCLVTLVVWKFTSHNNLTSNGRISGIVHYHCWKDCIQCWNVWQPLALCLSMVTPWWLCVNEHPIVCRPFNSIWWLSYRFLREKKKNRKINAKIWWSLCNMCAFTVRRLNSTEKVCQEI